MELKDKYPLLHYSPDPNCKRCNGIGEIKAIKGFFPCLCLFVARDDVDEVDMMLKQAAKSIREKHDGGHNGIKRY